MGELSIQVSRVAAETPTAPVRPVSREQARQPSTSESKAVEQRVDADSGSSGSPAVVVQLSKRTNGSSEPQKDESEENKDRPKEKKERRDKPTEQ